MQTTKVGFNIQNYFRRGERRLIDQHYGQIFLDGYAEYEGQKYAFEYNGCAFHFCPHCGRNPEKKQEEETRQRFIKSKVDFLEVKSSCVWNREKTNHGDIKPELFKYHNKVLSIEQIEDDIMQERLFGVCKIDIAIPKERRSKWEARNFPPIIAKKSLSEDQISEEMRNLLYQKKTKFPLGKIDSLEICSLKISRSTADELLEQ